MRQRMSVIIASILGAFCLYCGQSALHNSDGGGGAFVGGAKAESPGSQPAADRGSDKPRFAPQTFTKLAEGDVTDGDDSPAIAVGQYRELVVYYTTRECAVDALFRVGPSDPFGQTGQTLTNGGRVRVDGSELRLTSRTCKEKGVHYIVAAVQ